jgi:hypothetical protein
MIAPSSRAMTAQPPHPITRKIVNASPATTRGQIANGCVGRACMPEAIGGNGILHARLLSQSQVELRDHDGEFEIVTS